MPSQSPDVTIRAHLHMVLARLDADPESPEEWDVIVGALSAAHREAKAARGPALRRCGSCNSCIQGGPCLRTIAATTLRRLASEMRAAATIGSLRPAALVGDYDRACALLAETRREAVADLERLRDTQPLGGNERDSAVMQILYLRRLAANLPEKIDRWAAAWEASP